MPKIISFKELLEDEYMLKILSSLDDFKSMHEISYECEIPLASCYRRIKLLKKFKLVNTIADISKGVKSFKYKKNDNYFYQIHNIKSREILDCINNHPGISFMEIKKITGFSNHVLSQYIEHLISFESIFAKKTNNTQFFFPITTPHKKARIIVNLRKKASKKIVSFLLRKEMANFAEIKKEIGGNPSSVFMMLSKLRSQGIIKKDLLDGHNYFLADRDSIKNCI